MHLSTKELLAAIVESSEDAIISETLGGTITSWNYSAERLFGYSVAEAIGTHLKLLPRDREDEDSRVISKLLQGHHVKPFETIRVTKDGRKLNVSMAVSPIWDNRGIIIGVSQIIRDITYRKTAEAKLVRYAKELERSNEELDSFAHICSHDLQEPVRIIESFSKLLREKLNDSLDEKSSNYLYFIEDGAVRMRSLIQGILDYARVNSTESNFDWVDCNLLVKYAIGNLKTLIKETNANIIFNDLPVIWGDKIQILQLFQNLIGNAIKFHGDKTPEIIIKTQTQREEWVFSIQDNGIGFTEDDNTKIFDMFQRLNGKEEYSGAGIGLAISKKIVEKHNGSIWVKSEPGVGSTFFFSIPCMQVNSEKTKEDAEHH